MTSKNGPSNVVIALVIVAAMTAAVACSDDKNDGAASAGQAGVSGSSNSIGGASGESSTGGDSEAGAAPVTTGGMSSDGDSVDYTTCAPATCDAEAQLDFDFSGSWNESLVFTSNDCDPSLAPLLPPGFEMADAIFTDVIEGACFRPTPDSETYTGKIAVDVSEADYCTTSKYPAGDPFGDVDLVTHIKWTSIKSDKITGTSAVYVAQAGCTLVGDYTLIRAEK